MVNADRIALLALAGTATGQMSREQWNKVTTPSVSNRLNRAGLVIVSGLTYKPSFDYIVSFTEKGAAELATILALL